MNIGLKDFIRNLKKELNYWLIRIFKKKSLFSLKLDLSNLPLGEILTSKEGSVEIVSKSVKKGEYFDYLVRPATVEVVNKAMLQSLDNQTFEIYNYSGEIWFSNGFTAKHLGNGKYLPIIANVKFEA